MTQLTEVKKVRQIAGEARRRWFSSSNLDLTVWVDENDAPIAFELCYDKGSSEHAFIWRSNKGYSHMAVDDGEQMAALGYKQTPILLADGHFDPDHIRDLLMHSAENLPPDVLAFVGQKIMQHPDYLNTDESRRVDE